MNVVAIVNPAAGRGGAAKSWETVRAHLSQPVRTLETNRRGHATELTASAIREGAKAIVAVGGDGTINEVVNGFFDREKLLSESVVLGIFPYGTGSDLQRTLQLPAEPGAAARLIEDRRSRPIDLLKVQYTKPDGARTCRYSINVSSFGMGGVVASHVSRSGKVFGGKISFLAATLRAAMTFKGSTVRLSIDNAPETRLVVTNIAAGNGRYHGGGMLACPRAEIDDGFFDVTLVSFMKLPELVRSLPLLYNGAIYSHPKVGFYRARSLRAESDLPTLLEIDGESLGSLPIEIHIAPSAIRVLA